MRGLSVLFELCSVVVPSVASTLTLVARTKWGVMVSLRFGWYLGCCLACLHHSHSRTAAPGRRMPALLMAPLSSQAPNASSGPVSPRVRVALREELEPRSQCCAA